MANEIINGSDLMVFVDNKSIALATSHSLSISAETVDTSNKDVGGGDWSSSTVKKMSWECSTENLYSKDAYKQLYDAMVKKTPVDIVFDLKEGTELQTGWTPATGGTGYTGKAIITSLEANAPDGDNATFSATFTGVGALSPRT